MLIKHNVKLSNMYRTFLASFKVSGVTHRKNIIAKFQMNAKSFLPKRLLFVLTIVLDVINNETNETKHVLTLNYQYYCVSLFLFTFPSRNLILFNKIDALDTSNSSLPDRWCGIAVEFGNCLARWGRTTINGVCYHSFNFLHGFC